MLIRAGDRRPPGRLIAGPVFCLTCAWRNGTSDLARRGSRDPLLSACHGGTNGQQRGLSVGQQPPPVPAEAVHDVGRAAVFICRCMAEVDQMISPAVAH